MRTESITLVRHGRIAVPLWERIPAREFPSFIERVHASGIALAPPPPAALCELAQKAGVLACSDLPRALESAQALAPGRPAASDSLFREAGVPTRLRAPFRLRPTTWAFLARALWYAGWHPDGESLAEARARSRRAAARLLELASAHGTVVLVAHGIINSLVARELRRHGWRGPRIPASQNWGATRYER